MRIREGGHGGVTQGGAGGKPVACPLLGRLVRPFSLTLEGVLLWLYLLHAKKVKQFVAHFVPWVLKPILVILNPVPAY